ncbi:hypothetical protein ACSNOI_46705, partial [Actinomadura kijaniata]|uniref:hypothetical protein n=1 Tax=Actinomadura kijaniata TaxID=46161 RepID=UPI003F1B0DDD
MSGEQSHRNHRSPLTRPAPGTRRATDAAGRDVAITTTPPGAPRPDLDRMRAVLSPHVVDVLDGDPDADPPYVVSRLVPGRS